MRRHAIVLNVFLAGALAIVAVGLAAQSGGGGGGGADLTSLYPDLRTVVPQHLNLVNEQKRDLLRFSNGIANASGGPWGMRPDPPLEEATEFTTAIQEIRSNDAFYRCGAQPKQVTACHEVVQEYPTSRFEFHPAHNHWHMGDVALFEVRKGSPTGPVVGGNSLKTTFCLIDVYRLEGNAPTSERLFWDCYKGHQGISAGWVDQYHQATPGQEVDLTSVPNGTDYFLVSTVNAERVFLEQDYTNNTAWVRFTLSQGSNGNRKVTVTGNSPCDTPGLCGANAANR
jgi:Lysyl oxidase